MGLDEMIKKANELKERETLLKELEGQEKIYTMIMNETRKLWDDSEVMKQCRELHKEAAKNDFVEYFSTRNFSIKNEGGVVIAEKEALIIELHLNYDQFDLFLKIPSEKKSFGISLNGKSDKESIALPQEYAHSWISVGEDKSNEQIRQRIKLIKYSIPIVQQNNAEMSRDTELVFEIRDDSFGTFKDLIEFAIQ